MSNTLEFLQVDGTEILVRWAVSDPVSGTDSTMPAQLAQDNGAHGAVSGTGIGLEATLGFDQVKTSGVAADAYAVGTPVSLFAFNGSSRVYVTGPVNWPLAEAPPPPPEEPTYTDWVSIAEALPLLTGPNVTGFRIEQTLNLLTWIWDRFADAISYQLRMRPASSPAFEMLATIPQADTDEISFSLPDWQDDARFLPGTLMIYQLRARLT